MNIIPPATFDSQPRVCDGYLAIKSWVLHWLELRIGRRQADQRAKVEIQKQEGLRDRDDGRGSGSIEVKAHGRRAGLTGWRKEPTHPIGEERGTRKSVQLVWTGHDCHIGERKEDEERICTTTTREVSGSSRCRCGIQRM